MTNTTIYVDLDEQTQQILDENDLALQDILNREKIDARVTYGLLPTARNESARTKDLVPIILASSAAIVSIAMAIPLILHELSRRPVLTEIFEPVLDENGNLEGLVKKYELVQPRAENTARQVEVSLGPKTGLVIRFSIENKEMSQDQQTKAVNE